MVKKLNTHYSYILREVLDLVDTKERLSLVS